MRILLCGGAGYIGCHTYALLVERGHHVAIADNLVNSSPAVMERLSGLTGQPVDFHRIDMRDRAGMTGPDLQTGDAIDTRDF